MKKQEIDEISKCTSHLVDEHTDHGNIVKPECNDIFKKPILSCIQSSNKKTNKSLTENPNVITNCDTNKLREDPVNSNLIVNEVNPTDDNIQSIEQTNEISHTLNKVEFDKNLLIDKTFSYIEPEWSAVCNDEFYLEIIKSGQIIQKFSLTDKPFYIIGRQSTCDLVLDHPSISRCHAIIQYRGKSDSVAKTGFYIFDLNSTHGTYLNKKRIQPKTYYRFHLGFFLKLGGSTRSFILQGIDDSLTDINQDDKEDIIQTDQKIEATIENESKDMFEKEGIDWGIGVVQLVNLFYTNKYIGYDVDDVSDVFDNPFAVTQQQNIELYKNDPKKCLREWFEREGYDLEYDCREDGLRKFTCSVELPINNSSGQPLIIRSTVVGKKREAVFQCAFDACQTIDQMGLLKPLKNENREKQRKRWDENDFYESDDDEFLDRTGAIERKRESRMKAAGKIGEEIETYDTLMEKYTNVVNAVEEVQLKLKAKNHKSKEVQDDNADSLDVYMSSLRQSEEININSLSKLKMQLNKLQKDRDYYKKLLDITKPLDLPPLQIISTENGSDKNIDKSKGNSQNGKHKVSMKTEHSLEVKKDELSCKSFESVQTLENRVECFEYSEQNHKNIFPSNEFSSLSELETPEHLTLSEDECEKPKKIKMEDKYDDVDMSYSSISKYDLWLPPSDQKGDGRTKLNEKYGY